MLAHTSIGLTWVVVVAAYLAPCFYLASLQLGSCSDMSPLMSLLCLEPSSGCTAESLVRLGSPLGWVLCRACQGYFRLSGWLGPDKL